MGHIRRKHTDIPTHVGERVDHCGDLRRDARRVGDRHAVRVVLDFLVRRAACAVGGQFTLQAVREQATRLK
jgi:hypothetical protein